MTKINFEAQLLRLKKLWRITLIALSLSLCSVGLSAQSTLDFDKDRGISIPENTSMSYDMQAELGTLFNEAQEAKDYFKKYNTEITTTTLDLESGTITISFEFRAKPDWTNKEWNEYLQTLNQKN